MLAVFFGELFAFFFGALLTGFFAAGAALLAVVDDVFDAAAVDGAALVVFPVDALDFVALLLDFVDAPAAFFFGAAAFFFGLLALPADFGLAVLDFGLAIQIKINKYIFCHFHIDELTCFSLFGTC